MEDGTLTNAEAALNWLASEWAAHLRMALEMLSGSPAEVETGAAESTARSPDDRCWRQPYSASEGSAVFILATENAWKTAGRAVLAGAGLSDGDAADLDSAYREALVQSLSGLSSSLAARAGREVLPVGGELVAEEPVARAVGVRCRVGPHLLSLTFFATEALQNFLLASALPPARPAAPPARDEGPPAPAATGPTAGAPAAPTQPPSTMALLYDVELPISVSFGRAHLPLREVLRLTSGSIVELNRAIAEPVELIVNNCVVARGEVVVVEGNYGVRILQIVSQNERIRTLH